MRVVCRLTGALPGNGFLLTSYKISGVWFLLASSVALAARTFIGSADTFGGHLLRATVIPYLGCLVYLSLSAGLLWLQTFYTAD